jgi:hypothetical protein
MLLEVSYSVDYHTSSQLKSIHIKSFQLDQTTCALQMLIREVFSAISNALNSISIKLFCNCILLPHFVLLGYHCQTHWVSFIFLLRICSCCSRFFEFSFCLCCHSSQNTNKKVNETRKQIQEKSISNRRRRHLEF